MFDVFSKLDFFTPEEFDHPRLMSPTLLFLLDSARHLLREPIVITGDYRNDPTSMHSTGKAVDIRCHDPVYRYHLISALLNAGFPRILVYDRHIHVDIASSSERAIQPVIRLMGESS